MQSPKVFKYNYTFLYQSMAVYATTLAVYLVVRGLMRQDFSQVLYDPVVYLLCVIILASALAVLYNAMMQRRIELSGSMLALQRAVRREEIERSDVRAVRLTEERTNGFRARANVITIFANSRRRPIRIVPYNFAHGDELFTAIKEWAGDKVHIRDRRTKRRTPRPRP
jgi:hypothetical protein